MNYYFNYYIFKIISKITSNYSFKQEQNLSSPQ